MSRAVSNLPFKSSVAINMRLGNDAGSVHYMLKANKEHSVLSYACVLIDEHNAVEATIEVIMWPRGPGLELPQNVYWNWRRSWAERGGRRSIINLPWRDRQ